MLSTALAPATPLSHARAYSTVFVGAGAAGTGPLVCAVQQGLIHELLASGVAVLDRGPNVLHGTLGRYVVRSDTLGATFLECLGEDGDGAGALSPVRRSAVAESIAHMGHGPVPLEWVGAYLQEVGRALEELVADHPTSGFFPRTRADAVRQLAHGGFATEAIVSSDDRAPTRRTFLSQAVVLATGGRQSRQDVLSRTLVPGVPLNDYADKVLLTDVVLTRPGVAELRQRLAAAASSRVVVIGSSHSAFSSLWTLLNLVHGAPFADGAITLLHRSPLRLFYASRDAAARDAYTDFDEADICPLTGRVHRLGGLRFDSGDLLRRIWAMPSAVPERRVALRRLDPQRDDPAAIRALLADAAVIIPAFGYRPAAVPVFDVAGAPIPLLGHVGGPLVDRSCRVLAADGLPIPSLYGIGLASGFVPSGALGGEPSFSGQTNGLWLYQNGVGEIILNELLARTDGAHRAADAARLLA